MLLELRDGIIYGPVRSRRIGSSLGINVLPAGCKVCTFDCLYCHFGWTDFEAGGKALFPDVGGIVEALERALEAMSEKPRYLTFSGNGEPTLHPEFGRLVDEVIRIRDRLAPTARTAIFSNSSTVTNAYVRDALSRLDTRIMKLDAGSQETLVSFNRPAPGIEIERIVEGLVALPDVTLQALFTTGPAGNFRGLNVFAWIRYVKAIAPTTVQIYTLARGCPSADIEPLDCSELAIVQTMLLDEGFLAEVF